MKQLVMCADDFALHRGVSEGIAALAQRGCITATSALVLSPRWPADADLLRALRGQLDVGLHLDWTSLWALAAGHGMALPRLMLAAALGRLKPAQARRVVMQQLDAFERVWQAPPDHVDGHQHVQQFPGIREALVQVLAERYGTPLSVFVGPAALPIAPIALALPYLRISRVPPDQADLKTRIIAAMGARQLAELASRYALPCAPALSGVYDLRDRPPGYAARMNNWLRTSPAGTLLMCHPAHRPDAVDSISLARLREYAHLGSAEFQAQLQAHEVALVRGSTLYRSPVPRTTD